MITITVQTAEERQTATDALREGVLHEVLGESLTIRIAPPADSALSDEEWDAMTPAQRRAWIEDDDDG